MKVISISKDRKRAEVIIGTRTYHAHRIRGVEYNIYVGWKFVKETKTGDVVKVRDERVIEIHEAKEQKHA